MFQFGLIRPGINHKKQIPGFDFGAVLEVNRFDIASDAGTDFHHLHSLEVAGVFVPVCDGGYLRLAHRDLGSWWGWGLPLTRAGSQQQRSAGENENGFHVLTILDFRFPPGFQISGF